MRQRRGRSGKASADFIEPCLVTEVDVPPSGPEWVHEIKHDGYRMQAHIGAGSARLLTRTGLDWTGKLGMLGRELDTLGVAAAILDGEAIVQDAGGVAAFHALQQAISAEGNGPILLVVFDLLGVDGEDWRLRPLFERKQRLRALLSGRPAGSLLQFVDFFEGDGKIVFDRACEIGLEGIVSKRVQSIYRSGASGDWVKTKCRLTDDLIVIGYVNHRSVGEAIGSLVLGYWDEGELAYAGRVGTGFSAAEAHAIWQALQTAKDEPPAVARRLQREQVAGVTWVKPALVVEVKHRGWTGGGNLRQASFKVFRHDKRASAIGRPALLSSASRDRPS